MGLLRGCLGVLRTLQLASLRVSHLKERGAPKTEAIVFFNLTLEMTYCISFLLLL